MSLKGDLESIPLWEVFQLISSGKKNGKFQIDYKDNYGEIYFKDGRIVYAKTNTLEHIDAIVDILLWSKGTFTFIPDTNPPKLSINLDPLEILLTTDKNLDEYHYFANLILIPINPQNLSKEEETLINLFDGKKYVKDVIDETNLSKIKALNIIKDLLKNKKLIKINNDPNIFWFYIFWRTWNYLLEEYSKLGISERQFKTHFRKILDNHKSKLKNIFEDLVFPPTLSPLYFYQYLKEENGPTQEDVQKIYEDITTSEKINWNDIFNNLNEFSPSAVKQFVSECIDHLYSLGKTSIDKYLNNANVERYKLLIEEKQKDPFIYIGEKKFFEEEILSWYLDGTANISEILEYPIWGKERTILLLGTLLENGKIISLIEDKKLKIIYNFGKLWDKIKKEYKSKKFYQEIYEKISELLEESAQDTKYVLEKIVNDYSENWIYVYQKLKLTEESEVRVFVDSVLNIISETEDEKIKEIIKNFKLNS
ncbi:MULTISPECIES: DUF4388 domain-containing protein [Dictyoglomus]|uniref:PatA-like N-terminal domain-containing protein n=1 Tax=Dictyoglomus turgidum (strain DSM 6724 / Z-1310) TaxID=515635 RepID=B8DZ05_DICTD|nr:MULTISPECIES: DUF4388 domain-containing protein [Dictyoglomus]ACK41631.1 conserved hypothetical protein [Dictyoglomus turgidum DSM 6724]HBU32016.1 DUF4388 domain-containing protein [Dictyoglomus sp.]